MQTSSVRPVLRAFAAACVFSLCAPLSSPALAQTAPADASPAASQPDRVLAQSTNTQAVPVRLSGHIPRWAKAAADLGPVSPAKSVQLTIGLSRSPALQAAFTKLLEDQQNPSSPSYHKWLTPEQIGQQYGPTQHDIDAVVSWLRSQGFTIQSIYAAHTAIRVSAPASTVAQTLHTELHLFARGADHLQAPTTEPSIPAALAPVVSYVAGLAAVPYHTDVQKKFLEPARTPATGTSARPNFTSSDGTTHFLFPNDFNTIYDVSPLLNSGSYYGYAQNIAILGGSRLTPSDLTTWESLSSLVPYQPNYIVPPGMVDPGQTSDGNQDEATLDFERAYGTAPVAKVDFLLDANWLSFASADTLLHYEVDTLLDPVLSLSFGVCEAAVTASHIQNEDAIFAQAAAEGISVFVSSGDSGVAGCDNHGVSAPTSQQIASINADCASSYVTCVGGTQFADLTNPNAYWSPNNDGGDGSALGYIPEGAFNEPQGQTSGTYQVFATGGGPSKVIPKPSWQTGIGVPADAARDTPDVSFSASSHDGYLSCLAYTGYDCAPGHGALIFSGTSASAPSMAGIAADLIMYTGLHQGNLNPMLYRVAANTPADFHDATPATSGVANCSVNTPDTCNNSTPGPNGLSGGLAGYPLTTGYDLATGLGSLDVAKLAQTILLPFPTINLTASPSTITISQTTDLTATVTAKGTTPTGLLQFYVNNAAFHGPVTLSGGVATLSGLQFKPAGVFAVSATYFGDTNYGGVVTPLLDLFVTNPNAVPSTTTLTVTPASPIATQTVTYTAAVSGSKGTPTGTVQFTTDYSIQSVPVTLSNGVATLNGVALTSGTHVIQADYSGDDNYASSIGFTPSPLNVAPGNTSTSISISPAVIASNGSTVVSSTVNGAPGGPVPTGSVALLQGTQVLGNLPLSNGSASATISGAQQSIPGGTYPLSFGYSGDSIYASSTSPTMNLTVNGAALSLGAASPTLTVPVGSSVADTITLSSSGFSGPETMTCAVTSGAGASAPTCSMSPNSLTLAQNGSATSILSVSTTAAHVAAGGQVSQNRGETLGGFGGIALAALLFGFLPRHRNARMRAARLLTGLLFLGASLTVLSGCGGGGGSTAGGSVAATTAGAYAVTVTATSGGAVTGTVTVSVNVQ